MTDTKTAAAAAAPSAPAADTNFYAVTHPLTGAARTTIVEASTMAKARAHVEKSLVQVRRATPRELLDCGGKTEKAGGGT